MSEPFPSESDALAAAKRRSFATPKSRRTLRLLIHRKPPRPPGERTQPVVLHLPPLPGAAPSPKPPVRIFIGSEPEQFRAERVLIWSIHAVRDPARAYEIHVMKDLAGYDRRSWTTGFTNYRYAIPHLAGGQGRAIYNDEDQIYLADPAELFDRPLDGKALLAIDAHETSVMLMDCERLRPLWPMAEVQRLRDHAHYRKAVLDRGLWGSMPAAWNARDHEYEAGRSRLLHYTRLYTQPWRPFPEDFRYDDAPEAAVWHALEAEADRAGFVVYTASRQSPDFATARQRLDRPVAVAPVHDDLLQQVARRTGAAGVCRWGDTAPWLGADGSPIGLAAADLVAAFGLERVPEDDVPWVLDALFAHARRAVYVAVPTFGADRDPADPLQRTRLPRKWWSGQLALAARRRPGRAAFLAHRSGDRGRWRLEPAQLG